MGTSDGIIIGGGIIGCSTALKLAEAGLKITLLEREAIGCEASRAAAGMLSAQSDSRAPGPFAGLCLKSSRLYRDFADKLKDISGIDPNYRDEGTLCLALDESDQLATRAWFSWQEQSGLPGERLAPETIRKLEPQVTPDLVAGVLIPSDHQIDNRLLMDAITVALARAGVQVIQGEDVRSIVLDADRVVAVQTSRGQLNCGFALIAAGSWSGPLLSKVGLNVPVNPARGQMLAFGGRKLPFRHVLHSPGFYLVPRNDGRIIVGSTVEYVGFRKGMTAGGVSGLLKSAERLVPELREWDLIEWWSGLRPDTADHLPVMGRCRAPNLFVATGHFRNGILLAPVTAELMAQCIFERDSEELAPFNPERFVQARAV